MPFLGSLKDILSIDTNHTIMSFLGGINNFHNITIDNLTHSNLSDIECGFTSISMRNNVMTTTFLSILVAIIIVLTIVGNLMVMISFKIEPQIRTISNSFLLSLAVADITIGLISLPLYSMYVFLDELWPLPMFLCDVWLSIDYTMSNASVANLLVISFDRYFSVTRPLTYRVHRTPTKAGIMIALAWIVSILLWTPWIMLWPRIVEDKRVDQCYIAFMDTSSVGGVVLILVTAIGAFFLPVFIMCVLYFKIYMLTEKRKKGFKGLHGSNSKQASVEDSEDKADSTVPLKGSTSSQGDVRKKPSSLLRHFSRSSSKNDNSRSSSLTKQDSNSLEINNNNKFDCRNNGFDSKRLSSSNKRLEHSNNKVFNKLVPKSPSSVASSSQNLNDKSRSLQTAQKKKRNEKKQDQKAAKTLSAILLAFIITWTPYNVFTVIQTFYKCAIPPTLYSFGYWLCYLNSTVNPVLYALCNSHFRSAFLRILKCQCNKRYK